MLEGKRFYNRYWQDTHIKINPFDMPTGIWTEDNFKWHLDFFKPFVKGRLLDFGSGDSQFLNMISDYCDESYGVDISDKAIELAHKKYPKINFQVLNGGGELPYQNNYFDAVCAIDVLEHCLDIESILEEIHRVLKPGGHFLIATSELTPIKALIISFFSLDKYFYPTSPHIRYFTKNNLSDILQKKNFRVVKYKKNRTYFGFIPKGQMVVAIKLT